MFAVVTCLQRHDPGLVAWAASLCVLGVVAGLRAYRRAISTQGGQRAVWIVVVALVLGSGAWVTDFMAMLAYEPALRISFRLDFAALSLVVAIVGIGAGAALAAASPHAAGRLAGGAVGGACAALMHFIGVAALRLPGAAVINPTLAAGAALIAVCAAATAVVVAGDLFSLRRNLAAGGLLVLAVCGLHIVGMASLGFSPGPAAPLAGLGGYSRDELAVGVSVVAVLILIAGGAMLVSDHFGARTTLATLESALACAPSAFAFYDHTERLKFWNEAYEDFLASYGLTPAKGVRFRAMVRAAESRRPGDRAIDVDGLLAAPGDAGETLTFQAPDGRWFQHRIGAAHDRGFVSMTTDISSQLALNAREAEARRHAESASRAKSEFLANMSHEFRTPLNGVLGLTQIMARDALSDLQRERLELIASQAHGLLSVLNGVLDLSRIEDGGVDLDLQPFDVAALTEQAIGAFAGAAERKQIGLSASVEPGAAGDWLGDRARIGQVLANLLDNAVKFTAVGEVALRVRAMEAGLCFEVSDTGPGVAPDKLEHIFDAFVQADASPTRRFGGAGLGLAISRELARLMVGELRVESGVAAGSTFSFLLPLSRAAARPSAADALGDHAPCARILAAEDNPTNQMILRALLAPLGADLTVVENGRLAVEAFVAEGFDVILMDIQMPEMNGVEATLEIRRIEQASGLAPTPIIAVTANVMPQQLADYEKAGMTDCVAKPIDMRVLLQAIDSALAPSEPLPALRVA